MRRSVSLLLGLGIVLGGPLLAFGCSGTSGLTCDDLRTCGAGADASVLDASGVSAEDGSGGGQDATGDRNAPASDGGEDGQASQCDDVQTYCGAAAGCVDTSSSPGNCGQCGHACPAPANGSGTCAGSTCGIACDSGYFVCDGACHSLSASPTDPCVVTGPERLAVFVSPSGSDSSTTGTSTAPVQTIDRGLALAQSLGLGRVYVCAGTYSNAVAIASGASAVSVFGGFDCSTWAYDPAHQPVKVAPAGGVPALTISDVSAAVTIENIEFDSANATGAGASSIAATVSGSSGAIQFVSCTFSAGSGVTGTNGVTPTTALPTPAPGNPADATTNNGGGPAGPCVCPYGATSIGASGGAGGVSPTGGGSGQPLSAQNDGSGGTSSSTCSAGGKGADAPSAAADGSGASSTGAFVAGAWTPSGGAAGTAGATAQGGGGGGGGYALTGIGNGGGGGGCGGCGGGAGGAGGGGGASIGVLVVSSASTSLSGCTIRTSSAGAGGSGAGGQPGVVGGVRGAGTLSGDGCPGGAGGTGGKGGAGGGGAGGVSAGVAWNGTAPTVDSATQTATTFGSPGAKGTGGDPGVNDGVAGKTGAVVALP